MRRRRSAAGCGFVGERANRAVGTDIAGEFDAANDAGRYGRKPQAVIFVSTYMTNFSVVSRKGIRKIEVEGNAVI